MEQVMIRVGGRTYAAEYAVSRRKVTVVFGGRWRCAEHGGQSPIALAGMPTAEMVRAELAAGGSPPEAAVETMPA